MENHNGYDCYLGILASSSLLAALSSKKMATAIGQLVLASQVSQLGISTCVYNLDVTDWLVAKQDAEQRLKYSKKRLVGFTLVAGNVDDSLILARWFKDMGADIILGGLEITRQTVDYYSQLTYIDGVIFGNGQDIITDIMTGGLNVIVGHASQRTELNFSNISVDYNLLFRMKDDHEGVSYIWGGDCYLRNKRCFFCSRQKRGFGFRNPEMVWQEIQTPFQKGIKCYYNTADSIAVFPGEFAKLVEARPIEMSHTIHKTFINASQVNHKIAEFLSEFNAIAAVGIESFGNLSGAGKGNTTDQDNLRAIKILAEHNVKMVLTFVLGLPGDTSESLKKNMETLPRIVDEYADNIFMVTVSPLLITIGSRAFDELANKLGLNFPINSNQISYYNPLELSDLYYGEFCQVDRHDIINCIGELYQKINNHHPGIEFDSKGITQREKDGIENH